jgi:hypothetical protein
MVRQSLLFVLPICLAISSCASVSSDEDETFGQRPAIEKVFIEDNGAWLKERASSEETPEDCAKNFILEESDVREFFEVARFATSREYVHDLIISRCYAAGRIVLRDGQEATWVIDRARLGVLESPDDSRLYFYCGKCQNEAYMEDCDIDCINEP